MDLPPQLMETPRGFPSMIIPPDNNFTIERWELGKKLFYDPILSIDQSISCGTCHKQSSSFSDNQALTEGVQQRAGTRNVPSLANIGYHPYFTREGGVPTLEMQILIPIQEHNEFNHNIIPIADLLSLDAEYVRMSNLAYERDPDPYVITRAISVFERSLISGDSRYDQHVFQESNTLSPSEIRGMDLFFSERLNCGACHSGFNFTNYAFENNGLYETYEDPGRARLTNESTDEGKFKVPSLRNINVSGPYMHDGSMETLTEVLEHYELGGAQHPNKSQLLKPFQLSDMEMNDILHFLESLTDESFLNNSNFAL